MYTYGADLASLPALPRQLEGLVAWLKEALAAANAGEPYLKIHRNGYGLQLVYHHGTPTHVALGRRDVNGHAQLADIIEYLNTNKELRLTPPMLWTCVVPIVKNAK